MPRTCCAAAHGLAPARKTPAGRRGGSSGGAAAYSLVLRGTLFSRRGNPRGSTGSDPREMRGSHRGMQLQTFASLLKGYRLAAILTQEGLAERSGISARAISDLERGLYQAPH